MTMKVTNLIVIHQLKINLLQEFHAIPKRVIRLLKGCEDVLLDGTERLL